jgi:type IV secretion system protein TrbF
MLFKRPLQRYGQTPEPVTPYQKAAQLWDDRIGSARVQAKNWRLASFGSLALNLILAGGMVWLASQSRITPYVVEVDKLGQVKAVGPAMDSYQPSDAQIAWHLARFIVNVRGLSTAQITSVVRASESSFQVKWTEQIFEHGALTRTERWTAILSLTIRPPRTAEAAMKNPLGLFITAIAWTKELDGVVEQRGP